MSISIKDVVAITGTPGLHKIVKTDDKAIIVESIDEKQKRQMVRGNMMASKIMDVSIYTTDDSEPLVNVLKSIQEKFGGELPITKKSSKNELMNFLREVLPNFDDERVYPSNIKKLVSWYEIIHKYDIDLNTEADEEKIDTEDSETAQEKSEPKSEKDHKADESDSIKKEKASKAHTDKKKADKTKETEQKQEKKEGKPEKEAKSEEKSDTSQKKDKVKTKTPKEKEKDDKDSNHMTEKIQKKSTTNTDNNKKKSAKKTKENPGNQ